jgi:hypothetical protein
MRQWLWSFLISLCLFSVPASSQSVSFGVKGGAQLTSSVLLNPSSFTFDSARKYIIGGSIDVGLPLGLSVEGDVLYHPFNLEVGTKPPPLFSASTLYDYTVFEFPVLAKFRLTPGLIRPYFEGGPVFRGSPSGLNVAHYGVTVGAGLEIGKRKLLRISPEIRYTRWGPDSLIVVNGNTIPAEQQNQLAVLLGISF